MTDIGSVAGTSGTLGTIKFINNNTVLLSDNSSSAAGRIHQANVIRNAANQITGFTGLTLYKTAPNINSIDFGPGGVLFGGTYPGVDLLQFKPSGGPTADKVIDLTPFGFSSSGVAVKFVPAGLPGVGELRLLWYNGGNFYTAILAPDGFGTYDVVSVTLQANLGSLPDAVEFVPAAFPGFNPANRYCLISQQTLNCISVFQLDVNGYPIVATRTDFVTGLPVPEEIVIDPLTNDIIFQESNVNTVYRISLTKAVAPPGGIGEGDYPGSQGLGNGNGKEGTFGFGRNVDPRLSLQPRLKGPFRDLSGTIRVTNAAFGQSAGTGDADDAPGALGWSLLAASMLAAAVAVYARRRPA